MAACQQVGVVEIGDGASAGDVHVAAYQDRADRRAWNQRFRLLVVANRTRPHDRYNTDRSKILGEQPQRVFTESGEDQRSLDGLQQVRVAWVLLIRGGGQAGSRSSGGRWLFAGQASRLFRRRRLVHGIDFQHGAGRSDTGDRLLGKLANTISDGADEFAVNVNRAAAHACDHAEVLNFLAMQPGQNDVGFRAGQIAQDAEDLGFHRFRRDAFEDGIGHAMHAGLDLVLRHDLNLWLFGRETGQRQEAEQYERDGVAQNVPHPYLSRGAALPRRSAILKAP